MRAGRVGEPPLPAQGRRSRIVRAGTALGNAGQWCRLRLPGREARWPSGATTLGPTGTGERIRGSVRTAPARCLLKTAVRTPKAPVVRRSARAVRLAACLVCVLGLLPPAASDAIGPVVDPVGRDPGSGMTDAAGPVARILGRDAGSGGFERALGPRRFEFPRDHGPHERFRTEWWYFTGQLATPARRRFGFQLTFFRVALTPSAPPRSSRWASHNVYMAHFAVTDVETGAFHAFERFARGAAGLAGARAAPFRVWVEDWEAVSAGEAFLPLRLRASRGAAALDVELRPGKPWVAQGDRGFSVKSDRPGNASYYYSFTRLPVAGSLRVDGTGHRVSGNAWVDREWSTSALGSGQIGWDWFAFHLDDGRDFMFYRLRRRDGTADPASAGVLVDVDGRARRLAADDVTLEVLDTWTSPDGGAAYPGRWSVRVSALALAFEVEPLVADQEHRGRFRYWEGAVRVRGADGAPVSGSGYVELVGYAR